MRSGDIVFYQGTSLISRVVSRLTKSPYSHVALAVDEQNVIEADRFIKTRISKLTYDRVTIMRADLTEDQRDQLICYAKALVGRPYDYLSIFFWLIRLIFNYRGQGLFNNANSLYCSELIDRAFNHIGIDLLPDRDTGDVLPSHLAGSRLLRSVKS